MIGDFFNMSLRFIESRVQKIGWISGTLEKNGERGRESQSLSIFCQFQ